MVLKKPEMVLLDVDGTLVDTAPDLAYSINCMLKAVGLPECGEDKVRAWIGNGIERLVKRALTDDFTREPENGLYKKAFTIFLDIYADNACKRSRFYHGVEEGLDYLKQNEFKIGCVTNKRARFTEMLLRTLGIYNDFGIVIAGDTLPKKKPDPMQLLHAARFFKVKPGACLMVGDSRTDVSAARAADFQIVCVSYGYNLGEDIRCANPDAVIDSLAELPELFNG